MKMKHQKEDEKKNVRKIYMLGVFYNKLCYFFFFFLKKNLNIFLLQYV